MQILPLRKVALLTALQLSLSDKMPFTKENERDFLLVLVKPAVSVK